MFLSLIIFLCAGLLGGSTGAIVKYLVEHVSPLTIVAARFFVGFILLAIFMPKASLLKAAAKNRQLQIGSFFFMANIVLYAVGIRYTSLLMAMLLYVPTALIVAIIGFIFLKEKLTREQIIGLFLAILGVSFLIYKSVKTSDVLSFGTPLGNILIALAVLSWSIYTVISRKSSRQFKPMEITYVNFLIASVTMVVILIASSNKDNFFAHIQQNSPTINVLLVMAAVISLLLIVFYQLLIKKTSAFTASLVTYMNPVVAGFLGIFLFKERLTPHLLIGGTLVVVAVFYSTTYQYIKRSKN